MGLFAILHIFLVVLQVVCTSKCKSQISNSLLTYSESENRPDPAHRCNTDITCVQCSDVMLVQMVVFL